MRAPGTSSPLEIRKTLFLAGEGPRGPCERRAEPLGAVPGAGAPAPAAPGSSWSLLSTWARPGPKPVAWRPRRVCARSPGAPGRRRRGRWLPQHTRRSFPFPLSGPAERQHPEWETVLKKPGPSRPAPPGTGPGVPRGQAGPRSDSCRESPQGRVPPNPRSLGVRSPERGPGWARSRGT